jgi:predicted O-methyltransferase YrrM
MVQLQSKVTSHLRSMWHRGDYPWLMDNLAQVYNRGKWARQRWDLRHFDPSDVQTLGDDPRAVVNWVFNAYGGALAPLQSTSELTEFADLVKSQNHRFILELGTARGGTLAVLCRMAAEDATIISVDLPAGIGGGGYPKWKNPILSAFAKRGQQLHLLRVDSHLDSTLERVRQILGGNQLDLLFIDADHSYDGALSDFNRYSQLVRPGGLICLHDVVPNPHNSAIEVDRVWEDVSPGRQNIVIKDPANLPRFGIGVVTV